VRQYYAPRSLVLKLFMITFVAPFLLVTIVVLIVSASLPSSVAISAYQPYLGTKVYDKDDQLVYEFAKERRVVLTNEEVPEMLKAAVLSIEDANFYRHSAIDVFGIVRAIMKNIFKGKLTQGGSTITQQLARNMYLTHERTMTRKIKEIILAYKIEFVFSKNDILRMYLNQIYLGSGAYGMGAAADMYFNKNVKDLTVSEAAMLAGMARSGTYYSPYANPEETLSRRNLVLYAMAENNIISYEDYKVYSAEPITVQPKRSQYSELAPYFFEEVRRQLVAEFGSDVIFTGGLNVYTTLDKKLQELANEAVQVNLKEISERNKYMYRPLKLQNLGNPRYSLKTNMILEGKVIEVNDKEKRVYIDMGAGMRAYMSVAQKDWGWDVNPLTYFKAGEPIVVKYRWADFDKNIMEVLWEREPYTQVAFVGMEPKTGYIVAQIGGADFKESQFNRVTQSKLSIGSTIKPLYYAAAIESRQYTMASVFLDSPFVWETPGGSQADWRPRNYDDKFTGPLTLYSALAMSINVVSAKLMKEIGETTAVEFMRRIGVESDMPAVPSLSVGVAEISPLELARAYCTFASGGQKVTPIYIRKITDTAGNVIKENTPQPTQVISPQLAFIMNNMNRGIYEIGTAAFFHGAFNLNHGVISGKTGTTDGPTDLWLVAYTPNLLLTSWIGFDYKQLLGAPEYGGLAHGKGFSKILNEMMRGKEKDAWPVPEGVVSAFVNRIDGRLAKSGDKGVTMWFFPGTQPTEYSEGGDFGDISEL